MIYMKKHSNSIRTYLVYDGRLYKIGKSGNPLERVKGLRTGNVSVEMICYGDGISEEALHALFHHKRVNGEWFALSTEEVDEASRLIKGEGYPEERLEAMVSQFARWVDRPWNYYDVEHVAKALCLMPEIIAPYWPRVEAILRMNLIKRAEEKEKEKRERQAKINPFKKWDNSYNIEQKQMLLKWGFIPFEFNIPLDDGGMFWTIAKQKNCEFYTSNRWGYDAGKKRFVHFDFLDKYLTQHINTIEKKIDWKTLMDSHQTNMPDVTGEKTVDRLAQQGQDPEFTPEILKWIKRQPRIPPMAEANIRQPTSDMYGRIYSLDPTDERVENDLFEMSMKFTTTSGHLFENVSCEIRANTWSEALHFIQREIKLHAKGMERIFDFYAFHGPKGSKEVWTPEEYGFNFSQVLNHSIEKYDRTYCANYASDIRSMAYVPCGPNVTLRLELASSSPVNESDLRMILPDVSFIEMAAPLNE